MTKTHVLSLFSLLTGLTASSASAFAAGESESPDSINLNTALVSDQHPDCDDYPVVLSTNPSVGELECKMLQNPLRCGAPLTTQLCREGNLAAASRGQISADVARLANKKGVCVIAAPGITPILGVCPIIPRPINENSCDNIGDTVPEDPSLQDLKCHLQRFKKAGVSQLLGVDSYECERLNQYSAAQGVVSQDVADEATRSGICIIAPAAMNRVVMLTESVESL